MYYSHKYGKQNERQFEEKWWNVCCAITFVSERLAIIAEIGIIRLAGDCIDLKHFSLWNKHVTALG